MQKLGLVSGLLIAISVMGCVKKVAISNLNAIHGSDDRAPLQDQKFEALVGYLASKTENVPGCTAFLSDKSVITTANHCMRNSSPQDFVFVLGDGTKSDVKSVNILHADADVIELSIALDNVDFIPKGSVDSDKTATIISYDKTQLLQSSGKVNSLTADGVLAHNMDTVQGASGSPVIQNGKVVAVHIGYLDGVNEGELKDKTIKPALNVAIDINQLEQAKATQVADLKVEGCWLVTQGLSSHFECDSAGLTPTDEDFKKRWHQVVDDTTATMNSYVGSVCTGSFLKAMVNSVDCFTVVSNLVRGGGKISLEISKENYNLVTVAHNNSCTMAYNQYSTVYGPCLRSIQTDNQIFVINSASKDIAELYISPSTSNSWGPNLIPFQALSHGYQMMVGYLSGNQCIFDIQVKFAGGAILVQNRRSLCNVRATVPSNGGTWNAFEVVNSGVLIQYR